MNIYRCLRTVLAACLPLALNAAADETIVRIGTSAGPHAQILEQVGKLAASDGLKIQAVEYSDYAQPNAALAAGELAANSFQHQPYLANQVRERGYRLVAVATTVTFPMGLYSRKVKSLSELPSGARIAIPKDPTNGGRALLLMEKNGLLKLKTGAGLKASPLDIADNPKRLSIREVDAAELPRVLGEVDAAAINTNFALPAGLDLARDTIAVEDARSPYVNVLVVREEDRNAPWLKVLIRHYHSPAIKSFVEREFKGAVVVPW